MRTPRFFFTLALLGPVLVPVLVTGCKAKWKCEAKSKCSADPAPLAWAVAQCRIKLADTKCGETYRTWMQCQWDHVKCDAHDRTDLANAARSCEAERDDYLRCANTLEQPPVAPTAAPPDELPSGHPPVPRTPAAR
jgi:hypothetical protein